jgi:hypothetical protein
MAEATTQHRLENLATPSQELLVAGTNSAGINSAGINSAGTNSAGINSVGINSVGINSVGINSVGTNNIALPSNRAQFQQNRTAESSSDFLASIDSPRVESANLSRSAESNRSELHAASQVANYFVDNILGRMNSMNASNEVFSATLPSDQFDAVFGNSSGKLDPSRPSNGLMGQWKEARSYGIQNHLSPRSAFATLLAETYSPAALTGLLGKLQAITAARSSFLSSNENTVVANDTAIEPLGLQRPQSFTAGSSLLPPAPKFIHNPSGTVNGLVNNSDKTWHSIFEAAPIVVVPTARDVLENPHKFLKKGQEFYSANGSLQSIKGESPIVTLNEIAKSLGLPSIPSELYTEKISKEAKITGTASYQSHTDEFGFGGHAQISPNSKGEHHIALEYSLAREIAAQMGIPYSETKQDGGENQLRGTLTITGTGAQFPVVVDSVVSEFGMRNWQRIVSHSMSNGNVVDVSNTSQSRIAELRGALVDQIPELRSSGSVKTTLALYSGNRSKELSPDVAMEKIGKFYKSLPTNKTAI